MRETTLDDAMEIISSREEMFGSQAAKPNPADALRQKKAAYVEVVEQPAGKGLRFRYECEGRSAGSIPGATSTTENRTCPTIKVHGYSGRAVVVVSCVTAEQPYRPHPHNLVGKEGCKKGVCTLELAPDMSCSFPSLGIQCVKKKDIEESLSLRQQIRVDPFQTGFSHKSNSTGVDLNCVRLAFQVFLEGNEKGAFTFALKPVVSDPIYDKKSKCDLTICRLTETSGPVAGGKEILLFCEKITKDDIQVRFFEEVNDELVWEAFGDFQPSDVHKQYGICFRTPKYKNIEIESPVQVQLQLRRPSDGGVSAPRPFEFLPLDAGRAYWSAKRLKTNYSVFNQILSADQAVRCREAVSPLRHKVPRGDAAVDMLIGQALTNHNACGAILSADEIKEEDSCTLGSSSSSSMSGRQLLKPVAMPGAAFSLAPILQPGSGGAAAPYSRPVSVAAAAVGEMVQPPPPPPPPPPPAVPVRSPHKSSLLQNHLLLGQQQQSRPPPSQQLLLTSQLPQLPPSQMPQPPLRQPHAPLRPTSDLSLMSDLSQFVDEQQRISLCTQQSINEVLSLAEFDLDNISVNTFMQEPMGRPLDTAAAAANAATTPMMAMMMTNNSGGGGRQLSEYLGGSMSSVATVKEIKLLPSTTTTIAADALKTELPEETTAPTATAAMGSGALSAFDDPMAMDLDIGQIYDDVMQCVYDDVDTKYDDIAATLVEKAVDANNAGEPPIPPLRKRGLSIDKGVVDRPLPVTPRNPTLIDKIAEKKNELLREREREAERKRAQDEAKRKEREAAEEAKRVEREEKEKRKQEERERRRQEEEERRAQKRREEEERRGKQHQQQQQQGGGEGAQSLFQRLFQRGATAGAGARGVEDEGTEIDGPVPEGDLATPPPIPAHASPATSLHKVSLPAGAPPPVPAHQSFTAQPLQQQQPTSDLKLNNPPPTTTASSSLIGYDDFTEHLADVEQTIRYCDTSAGMLQRLDSVVNEFTSQYPVESPAGAEPTSPARVQSL